MDRAPQKGLVKHIDFILLDLIFMQVSFVLAYWIFHKLSNPYRNDSFQYQAVVIMASQMLVIAFSNNYGGILRRGRIDEAVAVIKYTGWVFLIALVYLFVVHRTGEVSRLQYGGTVVFFVILDYVVRLANKWRLLSARNVSRSLVLVTTSDRLEDDFGRLSQDKAYFLDSVVLLDDEPELKNYKGIPVMPYDDLDPTSITRRWVDEVLIMVPDEGLYAKKVKRMTEGLINVGIDVSCAITLPIKGSWNSIRIRKIGPYKVFTAGRRSMTATDAFVKRCADIAGGVLGCIVTGILYIFIAPLICVNSPGPVIFVQERIGKNGKPFRMYKFRTMYPDAEQRKSELLEKNKIGSDKMFKLDDDPRIIGSEKKDRHGRPRGIGNILRKYSIDEFPQFVNVLRGDMSLVGWRPCTPSEWERYELEHRTRASMKPGITGLWQVEGRSAITDFDEVVAMDREYFDNWSFGLDVRIILKTIWVVITGKGAA